MPLSPTEEQVSLAEAVRDWGSDRANIAAAHHHEGKPENTREAIAAAAELGLLGLLDPDEGGTQRDLGVVVEELGATGSDAPIGAAALALATVQAVGLTGVDAAATAAADLVLLPAVAEPDGPPIIAEIDGDSITLSGVAGLVSGAAEADWFLVVAATAGGDPVLALVPAGDVSLTARVTLDISRAFGAVGVDGVQVGSGRWASGVAVVEPAALLLDALAAHAVADATGAAAELATRTYVYIQEREQFGQAIAKFQAVKHHAATMAMDVEAAQSIVADALNALDGADPVERARRVSVAGTFAGEACSRVAGTALQLHGGMGFTWEHDLHILLRRIKTDEMISGSPRWHRQRLVTLFD
jgi:alkylation response protein AidB-like acyl-CoA dehydrogenase